MLIVGVRVSVLRRLGTWISGIGIICRKITAVIVAMISMVYA